MTPPAAIDSRRLQDVLPVGGAHSTAKHPPQAFQVGHVRELRSHRLSRGAEQFFAHDQNVLSAALRPPFVEDHLVGIGIFHRMNSSTEPRVPRAPCYAYGVSRISCQLAALMARRC